MGLVRYSRRAEDDFYEIAIYTVEQWGTAQADRYMAELEAFCELLADFPGIGRECDEIAPQLRRMEHESHVVFFFSKDDGILVSRVFHKKRNISDEEFDEFG
jgi:toxin ParE1/3/4